MHLEMKLGICFVTGGFFCTKHENYYYPPEFVSDDFSERSEGNTDSTLKTSPLTCLLFIEENGTLVILLYRISCCLAAGKVLQFAFCALTSSLAVASRGTSDTAGLGREESRRRPWKYVGGIVVKNLRKTKMYRDIFFNVFSITTVMLYGEFVIFFFFLINGLS